VLRSGIKKKFDIGLIVSEQIKKIKLSDLKPDPRNANKGTERGRGMLEKSIQELGLGRSVLVDKNNTLIAGNKSWEVAGEVGLEDAIVVETTGDKLVVVKRTDLDLSLDEKAKKLAIADNRVGQVSLEFDPEVLAELSQEIDLSGYFTGDELADLIGEIEEPQEEDEEEVEELLDKAESNAIESRVNPGEVWKLGKHFVCCADSTVEANVKKLLGFVGDRAIDMVWADPPYGIEIVKTKEGLGSTDGAKPFGSKEKRGSVGASVACAVGIYAPIAGDNSIDAAVNCYALYQKMCPESVIFLWGGNYFAHKLPPSPCWIVWDKRDGMTSNNFADAEVAWTNQSSPIRVFAHLWNGMIKASEKGERRVHPTQKPVALAEWCFEEYGRDRDLIIDPFLGSGMSLIAAQQMSGDRTVIGFELSKEYCEIVLRRYELLTGEVAELAGRID
jgi:hypothetical protein